MLFYANFETTACLDSSCGLILGLGLNWTKIFNSTVLIHYHGQIPGQKILLKLTMTLGDKKGPVDISEILGCLHVSMARVCAVVQSCCWRVPVS